MYFYIFILNITNICLFIFRCVMIAFAWNSELHEYLSFILSFLNMYLCSLHWALWLSYRPWLYIIYTYTQAYLFIYMYIYTYIYIHINICNIYNYHVYVDVYIYVYHIYIYKYIYIYSIAWYSILQVQFFVCDNIQLYIWYRCNM